MKSHLAESNHEWTTAIRWHGRKGNKVENPEFMKSQLLAHHRALLGFCAHLEKIADSLPSSVDRQKCLLICRNLVPVILRAHRFEEDNLFPLLEKNRHSEANLKQSLERLKFEHWEDESYAEEISEALMDYVMYPENGDAEKLSYMLRGFFESLRRHVAFEKEHLVPVLDKVS